MQGSRIKQAASSSRTICQHTTRRRRGGHEIIMDCDGCGGRASILEPECFAGVLVAVQEEGPPLCVTLRSHMEVRYGGRAARVLGAAAGILDRADILIGQVSRDSRKNETCDRCLSGLRSGTDLLRRRLLAMDVERALSSLEKLGGYEFPGKTGCAECAGMLRMQLDDMLASGKALRRELLAGNLRIVEAD